MSRYHEAAQGVAAAAAEQEGLGRGCNAYGCQLPGTISESTKGGGPWLCRYHFGASASARFDITTRPHQEWVYE